MAYVFNINLTPANGTVAMWNLINTLITAGWTKEADSDGTTYSNSGNQVTGSNSGANGLGNYLAWVRLSAPGLSNSREICIQRTYSDQYYWRIKYSPSAGFTTASGTPATVVPSATDEAVIFGTGSDASPDTIQFIPDGSYNQFIVADNSTGGFVNILYMSGTGRVDSIFMLDPLQANSYPNTDQDPTVLFAYRDGTYDMFNNFLNHESVGPVGFLKKGMVGQGFVRIPAATYRVPSGTVVPNNLGTNPHTGNDDDLPVIYMRYGGLSNPNGYKGVSSLLRWTGTTRSPGDTYNTKTRAIFGNISVPSDGSSSIIV